MYNIYVKDKSIRI